MYFRSNTDAGNRNANEFTLALQADALTNGKLNHGTNGIYNFYIPNSNNSGNKWSEIVDNQTVLMTLSQSIDTLLELPELRLGILCANYIRIIEGLLSDVMDYNIDLEDDPDNNLVNFIKGKLRILSEFTMQELLSLNNLQVMKISCYHDYSNKDYPIYMSSSGFFSFRSYIVPKHVLDVINPDKFQEFLQ